MFFKKRSRKVFEVHEYLYIISTQVSTPIACLIPITQLWALNFTSFGGEEQILNPYHAFVLNVLLHKNIIFFDTGNDYMIGSCLLFLNHLDLHKNLQN